ncbi:serine/threonine protein kinase [Helicocarpus griseus UAMH5409]|uniref:EKC/KEOPS complex subunit BUD32 n=1 Tax=Helicocarpus griseus UAMH5409 TaxID=1447875 RepID=A0A2B7XQ06_9EURO|nr:serine/threonine protein kinase [Helicocarpus griseus UAMH5409]
MDLTGQVVPFRFTERDMMGSGSVSNVFRMDRYIAVKTPILYHPDDLLSDEQAERSAVSLISIAREKAVYDALNNNPHPHILQTILHTTVPIAIFMPLMLHSLGHWMEIERPSAPSPLRLRWVKEVASAAEHLEAMGLVHGDIRPANVLLASDMHIKLADFDSCVQKGEECEAFTVPFHDAYEEVATHKSEQFAIGSFIYTLFTGHEPELHITGRELLAETLPNTEAILGGEIILKCWKKGYESVAAVAEDIYDLDLDDDGRDGDESETRSVNGSDTHSSRLRVNGHAGPEVMSAERIAELREVCRTWINVRAS